MVVLVYSCHFFFGTSVNMAIIYVCFHRELEEDNALRKADTDSDDEGSTIY